MKRFLTWCHFLRLPNLFTVPGDPFYGAIPTLIFNTTIETYLSSWLWAAMATVSILLYAFGIITNDLFDLKEDRIQRPERALPSGQISCRTAIIVAVCLLATAMTISAIAFGPRAFLVSVVLVVLILLYNGLLKHAGLIGEITMGCCRAVNVLFGATIMLEHQNLKELPWQMLVFALFMVLYYASITRMASYLDAGRRPPQNIIDSPYSIIIFCAFLSPVTCLYIINLGLAWFIPVLALIPISIGAYKATRVLVPNNDDTKNNCDTHPKSEVSKEETANSREKRRNANAATKDTNLIGYLINRMTLFEAVSLLLCFTEQSLILSLILFFCHCIAHDLSRYFKQS